MFHHTFGEVGQPEIIRLEAPPPQSFVLERTEIGGLCRRNRAPEKYHSRYGTMPRGRDRRSISAGPAPGSVAIFINMYSTSAKEPPAAYAKGGPGTELICPYTGREPPAANAKGGFQTGNLCVQ